MTNPNSCDAAKRLLRVMRMAWETGLLRGFSGNASIKLASGDILITASGIAKGSLDEDCLLQIGQNGEILQGKGKPSIELALHRAIYQQVPSCQAILHTHPVYLHILPLLLGGKTRKRLLALDSAESDYWRERLMLAAEHAPGSQELAKEAVAAIARDWPSGPPLPCAIWLTSHGLCALAESIEAALGVSEQLEHLAKIQWALLAAHA